MALPAPDAAHDSLAPLGEPLDPAAAALSLPPSELAARFERAQPRLLRIARALGVPPDATADVAQETLLRAWRHLARLRAPDSFDVWLDTICRNTSRSYLRSARLAARHELAVVPAPASDGDDMPADPLAELPDPAALDPLDALDQQDAATLLDRALGYLPPPARTALVRHYVAGDSTPEIAAALGVSTHVMEARLARARDALRAALEGPLRADAEAFGLAGLRPTGWQPTRIWCHHCGQRRLLGLFAPALTGRVELRLRCPACSAGVPEDIFRSKGIAPLDDLRSFGPALTRSRRALAERTAEGLASGWDVCLHCGAHVRRRVAVPEEYPGRLRATPWQHWVVAECLRPGCPGLGAWAALEPAIWLAPPAQRFVAAHPRWVAAPEEVADLGGRPAIRFHLVDLTNAARLTLLAARDTLQALAVDEG